MYDLKGQVAVVTGAAGRHGIGRAIALRLAAEGAAVVVNDVPRDAGTFRPADREIGWDGITSVAAEIKALGGEALAVEADVSLAGPVEDLMGAALRRFGRLDILVNNAAAPPGGDRRPLLEVAEEAFDAVMQVNVRGTFLCARAAGRHMVERGGGGRILSLSSCLGKRGRAHYAAYSASKFAIIGLTQSLSLELAPYGITVNALCPGPVDTERFDRVADLAAPPGTDPSAFREALLRDRAREIPLGRVGLPADVAGVAAFLASAEASYLTGLAVDVTGGFELP